MASLDRAAQADVKLDWSLVLHRMTWLSEDLRKEASAEYRAMLKGAAEVVLTEWRARAPRRSGEFIRGGRAGVDRYGGYVDVITTAKAAEYAAVVEFGGTIPVPHSRTNPALSGKRRLAAKNKPWIGGVSGTSYYLYPAIDDKLPQVRDVMTAGVQTIINKYLPDMGIGEGGT